MRFFETVVVFAIAEAAVVCIIIIQGQPTYYETYHPGRTLIFKVNSRYILNENYTASHYSLNVAPLHIPLSTFNENFTATDFSSTFYQFAENQNGLTDLRSILSVLSQTAVDRQEMKTAMQMLTTSKKDDVNINQVTTSLQNFAHQTLLLALSEISSPFVTVIFMALQILAFIWAEVTTVKCLKNNVIPFLCHAKKRAKNSKLWTIMRSPTPAKNLPDSKEDDIETTIKMDTMNPSDQSRQLIRHFSSSHSIQSQLMHVCRLLCNFFFLCFHYLI